MFFSVWAEVLDRQQCHVQLALIPLQSFVVLPSVDGFTNHVDLIPEPQIIYEEKSSVWINVSKDAVKNGFIVNYNLFIAFLTEAFIFRILSNFKPFDVALYIFLLLLNIIVSLTVFIGYINN